MARTFFEASAKIYGHYTCSQMLFGLDGRTDPPLIIFRSYFVEYILSFIVFLLCYIFLCCFIHYCVTYLYVIVPIITIYDCA